MAALGEATGIVVGELKDRRVLLERSSYVEELGSEEVLGDEDRDEEVVRKRDRGKVAFQGEGEDEYISTESLTSADKGVNVGTNVRTTASGSEVAREGHSGNSRTGAEDVAEHLKVTVGEDGSDYNVGIISHVSRGETDINSRCTEGSRRAPPIVWRYIAALAGGARWCGGRWSKAVLKGDYNNNQSEKRSGQERSDALSVGTEQNEGSYRSGGGSVRNASVRSMRGVGRSAERVGASQVTGWGENGEEIRLEKPHRTAMNSSERGRWDGLSEMRSTVVSREVHLETPYDDDKVGCDVATDEDSRADDKADRSGEAKWGRDAWLAAMIYRGAVRSASPEISTEERTTNVGCGGLKEGGMCRELVDRYIEGDRRRRCERICEGRCASWASVSTTSTSEVATSDSPSSLPWVCCRSPSGVAATLSRRSYNCHGRWGSSSCCRSCGRAVAKLE